MSARRAASQATRRPNRKSGQGLAELCASMVMIVPLLLAAIDCSYICIGASMNDLACRDAARAAAAGLPAASEERAATVIKRIYYFNLPMKVRDTIKVDEKVTDVPPKSMGGAVEGTVAVETTIDIYPPFVVKFLGSGKVALNSRHSMPITYMMPAS